MASSGRFAGVVMCVNTLWQLWGWVGGDPFVQIAQVLTHGYTCLTTTNY